MYETEWEVMQTWGMRSHANFFFFGGGGGVQAYAHSKIKSVHTHAL